MMLRARGRSTPAARQAGVLIVLALLPALAGCAPKALEQARQEARFGNLDRAISYYEEVLADDPGNIEARVALRQTRSRASQMHQRIGLQEQENGNLERALLEMELAIRLDPANETARFDLVEIQRLLAERRQAQRQQRTPTELAVQQARQAPLPLPRLEPEVTGPVTLDFRDAPVQEIYRTLAEIGGINVMFDQAIADTTTTFQVDGVTFDEALSILTASQGHFSKVLSSSTLLILPDDPTTRRQYADQILKTFYLSNADAANIANMLRNLLTARLVQENAELNTVTIRDTPEVVRVAERIIAANDKPGGEVLLDIEVMEVSRTALAEYGLSFSPQPAGLASIAQDDGGISLDALADLTSADIFVTLPSLRYQFFKENSDFKLIAQPQLRVTENAATQLLIGQRVPVVTTTFNPQTTSGGDVIPISSTNYEDVGIVIAAQPRVHHNDEITLDLEIEVSAVLGTSPVQNQPIFSSRRVTASIRLKDGETNLLAGLLRDDERVRVEGVPWLKDLPVVGNLFSNTREEVDQTDVVMSITPHILRGPEVTEEDLEAMYVGTEANVGGYGMAAGVEALAQQARQQQQQQGGGQQQEAQPSVMALLPARHVVDPGDEFSVDVTIQGVENLMSAGIRLTFDPAIMEYVDSFQGTMMRQGGTETSFNANPGAGFVNVGIARIAPGSRGVSGSGSLMTLVFRATSPGTSAIEIAGATVRGAEGNPLPVQVSPSQVQVRQQRE